MQKRSVPVRLYKCKIIPRQFAFIREKVNTLSHSILEQNYLFLREVAIIRNTDLKKSAEAFVGNAINLRYNMSVALVKEEGQSIACKIMLNCDTANKDSANLLSAIVEEILHTKNYIDIWQHYGHTQFGFSSPDPCLANMMVSAFSIIDEFIVGRKKLAYLDGMKLLYGADLGELVQRNVTSADAALKQRFENNISHEETISIVAQAINAIFDALGRDKARFDTNDNPLQFHYDIANNPHFARIKPFWLKIYPNLEKSLLGVDQVQQATTGVAQAILDCMHAFGVRFSKSAEGGCWVDYVG